MTYGDFKGLKRRTAVDKVLRDKPFNIAKNRKHDGYQRGLVSMVYNLFDKKTSGGTVKNEIMSNKQLAEELHKQIIRKFEKRKTHSSFIELYNELYNRSMKSLFHNNDIEMYSTHNEGKSAIAERSIKP